MILSRRPGITLALFVVTSLFALHSALRGEGDESLQSLQEDFLGDGNRVFSAGAGLQESQPQRVVIDIPAGVSIEKVLLYWGLRAQEGDDDLLVDGVAVVGELVGVSSGFPDPWLQPFTYRADITELGIIRPGANEVELGGLEVGNFGFANGAEIVVIADDGGPGRLMVRDGADFAYWNYPAPFDRTLRQRFSFEPEGTPREAELVLIVADHQAFDQGRVRPSTLEVKADLDSVFVFDDVLSSPGGDSWDSISVSVTIPANSRFVETQFFSETRSVNPYSPSSFYWLFAALRLPETSTEPGDLSLSGTVYQDRDRNGIQNPGERGIAGVELSLMCTLNSELSTRSTFTGTNGGYRFDGIGFGSSCTVVVIPSTELEDKEATGVCPPHIRIQNDVTRCDFGFARPPVPDLSLSGTVYNDRNRNRIQNTGEEGIAGVELSLVCTLKSELSTRSTVTDATGGYRFDGIGFGSNCTVTVVRSAALEDKEPTGVCPPHIGIQSDVTRCNFGFALPPVIVNPTPCKIPEMDKPGPYFLFGGPTLGPEKLPVPAVGVPGERVELCFYYCSPEDNNSGHAQLDHLQGLTMAICYDCRLECLEETFRVTNDTITSLMDAEFVSFQCDNDPNDGDGCEMILAVLVDANVPFDGRTLPPTDVPLKVASVDVKIAEDVSCGTCLPIEFCNKINGRGRVPLSNLFAAENASFPARTVDCELCVRASARFLRSDCNFDASINIADGVAVLSTLFGDKSSRFEPTCRDACDANDDGRINVADVVYILRWLFKNGTRPPAPGGIRPGLDPTTDKLDCQIRECR